ncbi:hypothetical protein [Acinetobacter phage Ab65]|nr:hypothetical protein [Acinetobacter phage Ab31]WMC00472.1 hypothetical protein [Acinetobacter phage Ab59]WMC00583.1 hypothetical protein [Acinetobacter phage Ab65]
MTIMHILLVFALALALMVSICITEAIKHKKYVQRKSDDQRKFNPIREKQWWK